MVWLDGGNGIGEYARPGRGACCRVRRSPWGAWVGWALQAGRCQSIMLVDGQHGSLTADDWLATHGRRDVAADEAWRASCATADDQTTYCCNQSRPRGQAGPLPKVQKYSVVSADSPRWMHTCLTYMYVCTTATTRTIRHAGRRVERAGSNLQQPSIRVRICHAQPGYYSSMRSTTAAASYRQARTQSSGCSGCVLLTAQLSASPCVTGHPPSTSLSTLNTTHHGGVSQ